ncbi:THO complex subunit 1 [Ceratocystis fimbriata CBS 114723]|uniref:THO complex subunit 1 n=1 Tax=Ceratocystis fimbriata CBS 114723 TaxID=1035309 RepID=A0A2C5XDR0_9PEZI|nr:THO complex subunit 1 [Ceratocystis fimbriata CBS 114723]
MESAAEPTVSSAAVIQGVRDVFTRALVNVENVKPTPTIDPALTSASFGDTISHLEAFFAQDEGDRYSSLADGAERKKLRRYAVVETAVRDIFAELIGNTPIDSPKFVSIWNLLDLLAVLSDEERCEPALLFWVIEELLDTQTISGCRQVFDYLESRRERITAKNFKQKHLVILRTCNELLRRLSRAEDTSFCGRVFIFMFQSFPLGDKSSVNLRGEYHVENVTVYDTNSRKEAGAEIEAGLGVDTAATADAMEVDEKSTGDQNAVDFEALYPVFWSLQDTFSQPKRLFTPENLAKFKSALELTLASFQTVRGKNGNEDVRRTVGTGALENGQTQPHAHSGQTNITSNSAASNFNPKYLTNRDLFELEIHDLSFRRHVLVQALIIMDFIISLTAKSKEKLAGLVVNKSVAYMDHTVSEQDAAWASEMKRSIADFLRPDPEGPFYLRMVETVLARDKNWVRWKIENCPSIERPAITTDMFLEAVESINRLSANKTPKVLAMGSLPLDFLDDLESEDKDEDDACFGMGSTRPNPPSIETFRGKLGDIDFDLDMEQDVSKKAPLEDRKAAISWQALRLTSLSNISAFDSIENADNIGAIYQEKTDPDAVTEPIATDESTASKLPEDVRLVVIAGPPDTNKEALVTGLVDKHPAVFKRVTRHTTREKQDADVLGHFAYVEKKAFSVMVDGDQFLEFGEDPESGAEYGTTRRMVTSIIDSGKVPVVAVPYDSAQLIKDMGFSARHILVTIPAAEGSEAVPCDTAGFDIVLVKDELGKMLTKLLKFIYEEDCDEDNLDAGTEKDAEPADHDISMGPNLANPADETPTAKDEEPVREPPNTTIEAAKASTPEPNDPKPSDDRHADDESEPGDTTDKDQGLKPAVESTEPTDTEMAGT